MITLPRNILLILCTGLLTACAVGPDYQRPDVNMGEHYRVGAEARDNDGWIQFRAQAPDPDTDWWTRFQDEELNTMMDNMLADNFDLAAAEARYRQARAALQGARSGLFPTLDTSASLNRSGSGRPSLPQNQYSLSGDVRWAPDLWGRVRRTMEGEAAGVDASAADMAATRLSLQSTLAQTYFRLRLIDAEKSLLASTVNAYERNLSTVNNQFEAGISPRSDVAAATAQLENARGQLQALSWQREQLANALAVLQGLPPVKFSLSELDELTSTAPVVPMGLPSELLQRRPDVVAAEHRVRQANAQIGVAQAAWFPDLTLSAQGGFRSGEWARWLTAPAQFWSLGPALALTLFDGGARRARTQEARASHEAQAATYKQTVLDALREVEDVLVELDSLESEIQTQHRATAAAEESLRLTRNQYEAGIIDYLSVVQVETNALSARRSLLSLEADRLLLTAELIAATGGDWTGLETQENP
ncbi:MAG TPA: efflux transporter outer membrane subunit [Burkholderiaceae bacterium]|nr:efflux transporter outer membrane subunit [Burkholderiaceae bacterium]